MNPQKNPLACRPVFGLIVKYSIPAILRMLVTTIYNITDQIFIGNIVGYLGNAATGVVFPVSTLALALAQLCGIGTAANFNMNMGAGEEEKARGFFHCGITLTVVTGLAVAVLVRIFIVPIIHICGSTESIYPYAYEYLSITSVGIFFMVVALSGAFIIRADGRPTFSMIPNVVGAVLNIGLDALFMYVFKWGLAGAAWATVTGQVVSGIICFVYYAGFTRTFKLEIRRLNLKAQYVRRIIKIGLPNCINQAIMMLANVVQNNVLNIYGALSVYGSDIPLAVNGVIAKVNSIVASFCVGISMGCQPIWSFNLGARNIKRVRETFIKASFLSLGVGVIFFIAFQFFPRQIAGIFGSGSELYFQFAEKYMRIYLMLVILYTFQPMANNFFTGTGNVKQAILLSVCMRGVFLIPFLFILPEFMGIDGVLYSGAVSDFLSTLLALILIIAKFRALNEQNPEKLNPI